MGHGKTLFKAVSCCAYRSFFHDRGGGIEGLCHSLLKGGQEIFGVLSSHPELPENTPEG